MSSFTHSTNDPVRYRQQLDKTLCWIYQTIRHGRGGSCAYYSLLSGWSKPYPETTGYLIPTLLNARAFVENQAGCLTQTSRELGDWLLSIQHAEGFWVGLLHPAPATAQPSVFNSAQIIKGLCALHRHTRESHYLDAAARAADWLVKTMGEDACWTEGNYRSGFNPSYYTQVAWPLLECWSLTLDDRVRNAAEKVLEAVLSRRQPNGAFRGWGFATRRPAFTHTIAYTLRGFMESARLLDDWGKYGQPTITALEFLAKSALSHKGRLPGAFHEDWRPVNWYCCLTGNAQLAICCLLYFRRTGDDLYARAAAALSDQVCACQISGLQRWHPAIRGAVAGSSPVWGRYMSMRYPNWAAKYHCDALMTMIRSNERSSAV